MSLQVEVGRTGLFIQIDETVLNLNTSQITVVSGDADTLNGEDGSYYLDRSNHTGTQAISTIDNLQDELDLKLDAADYNDRFLGLYASFFDLVAAYPTASAGDYAQVDLGIGSDVIIYAWDVSDNQWAAVGSSAIANTDALPEGSSNLYFTTQRTRDATLTGFSPTNSAIISTDNVVQAFGKAQGQINAIKRDSFDYFAFLGDRWLPPETTNSSVFSVHPWAALHNTATIPAAHNTLLTYILLEFNLCALPTSSADGYLVVIVNGVTANSLISSNLSNSNYFARVQLELFRRAGGNFGYLVRSQITGAPLFRGFFSPVTPIPLGVDINVELRFKPSTLNNVEHISTTNCTLAVKRVQNGSL